MAEDLLNMRRADHLHQVLREFCISHPTFAPLTLETVWHRSWIAQETRAFNQKSRWKDATGVYLFVDFCTENDIHGESLDERFSVIRRIGKAEYCFGDRMNDYCHRVFKAPGTQFSWDWWSDAWQKWFRYSQIDIIRTDKASATTLETYLLACIPTQCNDRDVPVNLKRKPIIYDGQS